MALSADHIRSYLCNGVESLNHIMNELQALGSEGTRRIFANQGAPADLFGVKVADMKTIVRRIKKDYVLANELFATGNADAQYLAGLIGDERKMSEADLDRWAEAATWYMVSEYAVPFVAADGALGWNCALRWIRDQREHVASAGWATLGLWVAVKPDETLDISRLKKLLMEVVQTIHQAPNRVRYTMNGFVIALGAHVAPLHEEAKKAAVAIGKVQVNLGTTSCKVPDALPYIEKTIARNPPGHKRKNARC